MKLIHMQIQFGGLPSRHPNQLPHKLVQAINWQKTGVKIKLRMCITSSQVMHMKYNIFQTCVRQVSNVCFHGKYCKVRQAF